MSRKKKGKLTKKNKALAAAKPLEDYAKAPHSFIITRGNVGKSLGLLKRDFRRVMEPCTAAALRERKSNMIKDFVALAGPLHVTHLHIFTQTESSILLKMCRMPRGPTLTFKIDNYSLSRDVLTTLKKQMTYSKQFQNSPCLMTNLQPNEGPLYQQVTARMFLDLFPTINPSKVRLDNIRRCCLINYDESSDKYEFRHYSIRLSPVGVSKAAKKLLGRKLPDLSRYSDISEYMTKSGMLSDSEGEDEAQQKQVPLPQKVTQRGSKGAQTSSVKLSELGPRLSMTLLKVEEGLLDGNVLHHALITKSDKEKRELQQRHERKRKLKELRKQQQEDNIQNKKKKEEMHKEKCLSGMQKDNELQEEEEPQEKGDVDYYREEVGEEPDEEFIQNDLDRKRKRGIENPATREKKVRFSEKASDKDKKKPMKTDMELILQRKKKKLLKDKKKNKQRKKK